MFALPGNHAFSAKRCFFLTSEFGLKGLSYHIWKGAIVARDDNEVKRFYAQSLDRTGDKRHARLNTQRKILDTLWTLWLRGTPYDPERFLAVPAPSRANPTPANTNPMS